MREGGKREEEGEGKRGKKWERGQKVPACKRDSTRMWSRHGHRLLPGAYVPNGRKQLSHTTSQSMRTVARELLTSSLPLLLKATP